MLVRSRTVSLRQSEEESLKARSILALTHVFNKQLLSAGCMHNSRSCFDGYHKVSGTLFSKCSIGGKRRLPRDNDI